MIKTVYDVTSAGKPDAPAIGAPGRPWLTYGDLKKLTDETLAALNAVGIGRGVFGLSRETDRHRLTGRRVAPNRHGQVALQDHPVAKNRRERDLRAQATKATDGRRQPGKNATKTNQGEKESPSLP